MMKKFFIFALVMLVGSVTLSIVNGSMNSLQMVAFSLAGVALVYGFALWAVLKSEPEMRLNT